MQVCIVTHQRDGFHGRYFLPGGVTVHYLPLRPIPQGVVLPTLCVATVSMLHSVLQRERVTLVHGHQVRVWGPVTV